MKFAGKCVVITGPLSTTEEFDQMATVAALVRDSGGFPVWAGDVAWPIEAELGSVAGLADVEARLLQSADIVIAMPGWQDSARGLRGRADRRAVGRGAGGDRLTAQAVIPSLKRREGHRPPR